jgi:hypothetical protein
MFFIRLEYIKEMVPHLFTSAEEKVRNMVYTGPSGEVPLPKQLMLESHPM